MNRTLATAAALAATGTALLQPAAAEARAADTFHYQVSYSDFSVCDVPASLEGTVYLVSRSTGAESGMYTSTFIERTIGTLTVGDDTYRYRESHVFSKVESLETNETRTLRLAGSLRLAGNGPLAGTTLDQQIRLVVDATGETRIDTSVLSFC